MMLKLTGGPFLPEDKGLLAVDPTALFEFFWLITWDFFELFDELLCEAELPELPAP